MPVPHTISQSTAALTLLAAAVTIATAVAYPAAADQATDDLTALHQRYLTALAAGDIDAVMTLFAEDAVYENALTCPSRICIGADAIRGWIEALIQSGAAFAGIAIEPYRTTYGQWTASRYEFRAGILEPAGVERIIAGESIAAIDGRIVAVRLTASPADEQTARFLAAVASAPAAAQPAPPPAEPAGRHVDVDGRRFYLDCRGAGTPAVIFASGANGAGASSGEWTGSGVLQAIAGHTTACAYDRAGYGHSDPGPRPTDIRQDADDLARLLTAAGIAGPVVLVGASYGAPLVQYVAATHPDLVAGLLLLDPQFPQPDAVERIAQQLPPAAAADYRSGVQQEFAQSAGPQGPGGGIDHAATSALLAEAGPLPDVPLVVLVQGLPRGPFDLPPSVPVEIFEQVRYDAQAALAASVPRGAYRILLRAGHEVQQYAPDIVVDHIREIVESAGGRPTTTG